MTLQPIHCRLIEYQSLLTCYLMHMCINTVAECYEILSLHLWTCKIGYYVIASYDMCVRVYFDLKEDDYM